MLWLPYAGHRRLSEFSEVSELRFIQDLASELRRTLLPRIPVNREGRSFSPWGGGGGRPCRYRNVARPAVRAPRGRPRGGPACLPPPRWVPGTGRTRPPARP